MSTRKIPAKAADLVRYANLTLLAQHRDYVLVQHRTMLSGRQRGYTAAADRALLRVVHYASRRQRDAAAVLRATPEALGFGEVAVMNGQASVAKLAAILGGSGGAQLALGASVAGTILAADCAAARACAVDNGAALTRLLSMVEADVRAAEAVWRHLVSGLGGFPVPDLAHGLLDCLTPETNRPGAPYWTVHRPKRVSPAAPPAARERTGS